MVMGNAWYALPFVAVIKVLQSMNRAILHDESEYPDPDRFNPDRFISKDGTLDADIRNPEDFAFGYGRRICPGRFLAASSVWLAMASILSTFELEMPVDEHGQKIRPSGRYTEGLAVYVLSIFSRHVVS